MTQLEFYDLTDPNNTFEVPFTSFDKYQCYPVEIGTSVEMISGLVVMESRGNVQIISYQYDCMGNDKWRRLASFLRSGKAFGVRYLPDNSDNLVQSSFVCTSLTPPKFAFEQDGIPYWHDIEFTLREVRPHD